MDSIGIDVHENNSHACILTQERELIERRVRSTDRRPAGSRPCYNARITVEVPA